MRKLLLARLEKLKAQVTPPRVPPLRYGYLTRLPDDYTGERHVVIVSRTTESSGRELCEFEERPGPAIGPDEDAAFAVPALTIYLSREPRP